MKQMAAAACALCLASMIADTQAAAALFAITQVRSDPAGMSCSDTYHASCGKNYSDDGQASSFSGYANAQVQFGAAGVSAHFEASNSRLYNLSFAEAVAQWDEHYIVPAHVHQLSFHYIVTGSASPDGAINAYATVNMFINGVGMLASQQYTGSGSFDFTLNYDYYNIGVAALPVSTQLRAIAYAWGPADPNNPQFFSGSATADYGHTLQLDSLTLYGSNGVITDIASINGESGASYRVDGYIAPVPEPERVPLLLAGLALLAAPRVRGIFSKMHKNTIDDSRPVL
jgi:hypothetical protein